MRLNDRNFPSALLTVTFLEIFEYIHGSVLSKIEYVELIEYPEEPIKGRILILTKMFHK